MASPPPVLTLTVDKGPRKGETRQCLPGAVLRVGRVAKGNDLAVRDVGASQEHLAIKFLPPPTARWVVSDLGSSNGSLLNGKPLVSRDPATLSHGDLIKIGESTVLTVSISADSDPNPGTTAKPGLRRSSRHAEASMEDEKLRAVTGRGTRKKALAAAAAVPEIPEAVNEEPDTEALVVDEKSLVVKRKGGRKKVASAEPQEKIEEASEAPRRGGRKKAAAPEITEAVKEESDTEAPVVDEKSLVVKRKGGRKKVASAEPQEKMEEASEAPRRGGRKKAGAPPQPEKDEQEEAAVVTRRGKQKKAAEPPEPESEEEDKEEEAPVVTRRDGRLKDVASVAPPPLPPSTRSRRYQGRSRKKGVLEDHDMEEHEQNKNDEHKKAAPSKQTVNLTTSTAAIGKEEEHTRKVAAGDGEVEMITALDEESPKGRAIAQLAASDNGGDEEKGDREEDGKGTSIGSGGVEADREKVQECAQRSSLETMTLREWFERMEKYLPRMINEAADEMIAELEKKHRRILEYISTPRD